MAQFRLELTFHTGGDLAFRVTVQFWIAIGADLTPLFHRKRYDCSVGYDTRFYVPEETSLVKFQKRDNVERYFEPVMIAV